MITHTSFTIGDRYAFLGSFGMPGVQGKFEVRSNSDRVKRPLILLPQQISPTVSRRLPPSALATHIEV